MPTQVQNQKVVTGTIVSEFGPVYVDVIRFCGENNGCCEALEKTDRIR
jgi:hypothetical protein